MRRSLSRAVLFLFVCVPIAAFLAGCQKKPLTTAQIHGVTQEFVAAAQSVVGRQIEITIRPELREKTRAGRNGTSAFVEDHISITLADPAKQAPLERALDAVARKHDLERAVVSSSAGTTQIDFARASQTTHSIQIIQPVAAAPPHAPKAIANGPMLAIIIDDLGRDLAPAKELLKLPYPLTISVIPNLPDSAAVADEAYRRGDQILLHFPMEAVEAGAKPEAVELRVGMQPQQVDNMLAAMLATVPHASGVNNHQGSRATADPALMNAFMPALKQRGLFFVDSRTTVQTVAYDTAERDGVPATYRSAQFLDDVESRGAILRQLDRAASVAQKNGWAITIGHPHPITIAALTEALPRLQSRGIRLVFVSDVVK
ncbi:MAG: divergent polysaccharide deacetylase family protein [Candidatus Acidiferrales bacterium]